MKKHYLILSAIVVLALAAMSCGIQFVGSSPTPIPQQAIQQNFDPGPQNGNAQGPDNLDPGQQRPQNGDPGPNPNGGNPGGGQILSFTADRTTINPGQCATLHWETQGQFGVRLDGNPVPPVGQQQECPTQTRVYGLELDAGGQMLRREVTIMVNGGGQNPNPVIPTKSPKNKSDGGKKTITDTPASLIFDITAIAVVANPDLAITNIYPSSTGHIMGTIKNAGNTTISGTYKVNCSAVTLVVAKDGTPIKTDYLPSYVQSVKINNLAPGKSTDFDTSFSRTKQIDNMWASCSLISPPNDKNSANDSMDSVQVK